MIKLGVPGFLRSLWPHAREIEQEDLPQLTPSEIEDLPQRTPSEIYAGLNNSVWFQGLEQVRKTRFSAIIHEQIEHYHVASGEDLNLVPYDAYRCAIQKAVADYFQNTHSGRREELALSTNAVVQTMLDQLPDALDRLKGFDITNDALKFISHTYATPDREERPKFFSDQG